MFKDLRAKKKIEKTDFKHAKLKKIEKIHLEFLLLKLQFLFSSFKKI